MPRPPERLANRLVLFPYFLDLLGPCARDERGMPSLAEVTKKLSTILEGDNGVRSYFAEELDTWPDKNETFANRLFDYDRRILGHVEAINQGRRKKGEPPVRLKFFQYLAALFTEHYLERYFADADHKLLQDDINREFLDRLGGLRGGTSIDSFSSTNLNRLAFSMATGSGKSHLITLHYRQLMDHLERAATGLRYKHILLITPHTTLSGQLKEEFEKSGIPCEVYGEHAGGSFGTEEDRRRVQILEITRLADKQSKDGQGRAVDRNELGKANIIFVDEAHRGSEGRQWQAYRNELCEDYKNSFIFEYSATFEEAGRAAALREQYARTILFHYPYRSFYADGFGKDYNIVNVDDGGEADRRYQLMTAALVTFAEQRRIYRDNEADARQYNIEPPLWIFIGTTVSATNRTQENSDVKEVTQFFRDFIGDKPRAVGVIKQLLSGRLPLFDRENQPVFPWETISRRLPVLSAAFRSETITADEVYDDILRDVFRAGGNPVLTLTKLSNAQSEIGLKAGGDYFGVINVGDTNAFIRTLNTPGDRYQILPDDTQTISLFKNIDKKDDVRILIGAGKFREGWSSWRVSTIGLLHVGQNRGTQIIQIFGRGVRLKGRTDGTSYTLKRSRAEDTVQRPEHLPVLETLNVFGIKAAYMQTFKRVLEDSDVLHDFERFEVPVEPDPDLLKAKLMVPVVVNDRFEGERLLHLPATAEAMRAVGILARPEVEPRAATASSRDSQGVRAPAPERGDRRLDAEVVNLLDWDRLYARLVRFRSDQQWHNLVLDRDRLRLIISAEQYALDLSDPSVLRPSTLVRFQKVENMIEAVLKEWVRRYYLREQLRYRQERMSAAVLTAEHETMPRFYSVDVSRSRDQFDLIKDLLSNRLEDLRAATASAGVQNVRFDRHLFQPLLARVKEDDPQIAIHPDELNAGEQRFVRHLASYLASRPEALAGVDVFLLRNRAKVGIGFYENVNYYPDFVLWLVKDGVQHLLFADPKGLQFIKGKNDEKVTLATRIHDIEARINAAGTETPVTLDAALISIHAPEKMQQSDFSGFTPSHYAETGIYFQMKMEASREVEDADYIPEILSRMLARTPRGRMSDR